MPSHIKPAVAARIKGALAAHLPHKFIAKVSGVPVRTIRSIAYGERWKNTPPDDTLVPIIEMWLKSAIDIHIRPFVRCENTDRT